MARSPRKVAKSTHRARPRSAGEWCTPFLAQLAVNANVKASAQAAGIDRGTAYDERERNPAFRAQWDAAIANAVDNLREIAWNLAVGLDPDILKFLLKAHDPMYREKQEITGKDGGPVTIRVVYDEPKEEPNAESR